MTDAVQSCDLPFLEKLSDSLCEVIAKGGDGFLVHLVAAPDGDGHDVGTKPLEGVAPAETLIGTVVPEAWWALGVAVGGWVRPLGPEGQVGERMGRAANVVVVTRAGDVVSRVRTDGRTLTESPAYGITLDAIQRALGLPTAPPLVTTGHYFSAMWLESIAAVSADRPRGGRRLRWAEVCRLHPTFMVFDVEPHPSRMEFAATVIERSCDWERLRWLLIEGAWPERTLSPTDAAWFDEGSFSRWVLGNRAPLPSLLDDVARRAGVTTARRCARVLHRVGYLGGEEWRSGVAESRASHKPSAARTAP
ncbi:MAG: hypothetical protein M3159_08270 [Actinomycetota bacterium]|nr:hypothetical protein [Actinomycetota bacterium]